ncbi:MAG: hypothetical protein ABT940_08995 [Alphaproteobacteria bacterium]
MKNIVLLTSALYTNYGIYNPQERIKQTLETARSAKKYIPGAVVILVDNSKIDVQNDDSAEMNELIDTVDYYIDNSDDSEIKFFHNTIANYDIGKNSMEALGIIKALTYISNDEDMMKEVKDASRIFKLSGRYLVTDKFDINKFDNANTKDRYVFKKAQPSWINPQDTGVMTLLQTRLWSFTPSLLDDTIKMYSTIIDTMMELVNQGKYIDNEHAMSKFIPRDKLVEIETVGLCGNIAPNGMMIID